MRACDSGSSAARFMSTPMRRIALGLLRARRERPSRRRAAEESDKFAPVHLIAFFKGRVMMGFNLAQFSSAHARVKPRKVEYAP